MADSATNINNLPDEILLEIFSYLSVEDLGLNIQYVCTRWSQLSLDDALWKDSVFNREVGVPNHFILSVLEKVPKLQGFEMYRNITEIVHTIAECCKNLRKLVVFEEYYPEDMDEALMYVVTECTKLEELTIPGESLQNEELAACVGQLVRLRALTLMDDTSAVTPVPRSSRYNLVPPKLKHMADGCPSLQHLYMHEVIWSYSEVEYFIGKRKNKLLSLEITCHSVEHTSVFPLLAMCEDGLRELRLESTEYGIDIDRLAFSVITRLSALSSLKLEIHFRLRADVLASVFVEGAMSQLLELEIICDEELNATVVHTICNNCANLLRLKLLGCYYLIDDGLKYLYKCTKLEELHLKYCGSLSDGVMEHVVRCTKLKKLILPGCILTEKGLARVLELSELRQLDLSRCDVDGLPLQLFPLHLKNMRNLTISECINIDTVGLDVLRAEMPYLHVTVYEY